MAGNPPKNGGLAEVIFFFQFPGDFQVPAASDRSFSGAGGYVGLPLLPSPPLGVFSAPPHLGAHATLEEPRLQQPSSQLGSRSCQDKELGQTRERQIQGVQAK